jgi:hypothetical protein
LRLVQKNPAEYVSSPTSPYSSNAAGAGGGANSGVATGCAIFVRRWFHKKKTTNPPTAAIIIGFIFMV